jgi:hypothetical protein
MSQDTLQEQEDQTQLRYLQLLLEAGCKFLFKTILFDKAYVWIKDPFGGIFLEKIPEDHFE